MFSRSAKVLLPISRRYAKAQHAHQRAAICDVSPGITCSVYRLGGLGRTMGPKCYGESMQPIRVTEVPVKTGQEDLGFR